MEFLNDYIVLPVVVACLVIGYCIKHIRGLESINNDYIPSILAISGAIICCGLNNWILDMNYIIQGALSGLASTGLHQAFSTFINGNWRTEDI